VGKTLGNIEAVVRDLPASGAVQYGEMLKRFAARAYAREMNGSSPDVVARAVHHALTARRPRIRYQVGKHAKVLVALPRILPDSFLDAMVLRMVGLPTKLGALDSAGNRQLKKRPSPPGSACWRNYAGERHTVAEGQASVYGRKVPFPAAIVGKGRLPSD
jgi:hypothetical protein